jgi:anhydro-N-acetylmuramic acid kinase
LVAHWLAHPYYRQAPPKTTGRELYTAELAATLRAEAQTAGANDVDFIATVTALTAATIADAYARFAPGPVAQVVIAGGGAHNPVLLAELRTRLAARLGREIEVCTHAALGIDVDAKEALTFALLAYLCAHGLPGNVPACTGARQEMVLGAIAPGKNYRRLEIRD